MAMEKQDKAMQEYLGASQLAGPLAIIEGVEGVAYNEIGEIMLPGDSKILGQVIEVSEDRAIVQLLGESKGLRPGELKIRFRGRPLQVPVAKEMLGRVFDGLGNPRDGLPAPIAEDRVTAQGSPLNPRARDYPQNYITTGISAIDAMNTLVRGQKLPIFSGEGLPHNDLAAQIASQAQLSDEDAPFAIVFVALGVSHDIARNFERTLTKRGSNNVALFLNLADDPAIERIITPRVALSLAEFLAYEKEMQVLVILTDITNYGESIREISLRREEVPTRKGFPGHLYSDLASIFERCGRVSGRKGSITQMPVVTMPNDDITHPIPDLTGYITEGQIVLSRDLHEQDIYPPIDVLKSLSRLMKDAIGKDKSREDHPDLADQIYAAYANVQDVRSLAEVIGEEEITKIDKKYLKFGEAFEKEFLSQGQTEQREMMDSLDLGWQILGNLPPDELSRLSTDQIKEYYPKEN